MNRVYLETEHQELFYPEANLRKPIAVHIPSALGTLGYYVCLRVPAKFAEKKGCFVTLTEGGQLRGCIGHILPQEPLSRAIADNAAKAALHDPRFDPVQPGELDKIGIEISVLTEPAALAFQSPDDLLGKLRPHRDGVVLKIGDRIATYLPQVWSQIPNRADFLDSLSQKAGCARADWRNPGAEVYVYQVESFSEPDR